MSEQWFKFKDKKSRIVYDVFGNPDNFRANAIFIVEKTIESKLIYQAVRNDGKMLCQDSNIDFIRAAIESYYSLTKSGKQLWGVS